MSTPAPDDYAARVEQWRTARDERLRSPGGWLALVGLYWLVEGENHFGAHPANQIVLHGHGMHPRAGSLLLRKGAVRLLPHADAPLRVNGAPAVEMELADDLNDAPTILELGTLRLHLIRRGERIGLRVRDHEAPALRAFTGTQHFPLDPSFRIVARFEPAPPGSTLAIMDVTGAQSDDPTPGSVVFEREGATWRIDALDGGDKGELWLIFGDATNGRQTYGGGRFLYTGPPAADGSVVVDFNLAYDPPCTFSTFATCPLPPKQNRLALRIEAGELDWDPPSGDDHRRALGQRQR